MSCHPTLRKHDTSQFVNDAQNAMLKELGKARNASEFIGRIPGAISVLQSYAQRLREGKVPLQDLVLTKAVTRQIDEYTVMTNSVAALKQMKSRGYSVEPGEYIRFLVTDGQSRIFEKKVKVAEFLEGGEEPDVSEYLRLLCRAGETLLLPFGHTEVKLLETCNAGTPPRAALALAESSHAEIRRRGGPGYISYRR